MHRSIETILNRRARTMDFIVTCHGSVWSIEAVSAAAKELANEEFLVEGWQGVPTNFNTDARAAYTLAEQLIAEGWDVRNGGSHY